MKIKYCLPIIKKNKKEVLQALATKGYDYFEVWIDYINDLDEEFVKDLIKSLEKKLIIVFRRKYLEKTNMDELRRYSLLSLLNKKSSLVDLDLLTQKKEITFIKKERLKLRLILSYHNYLKTPNNEQLSRIIQNMKQHKPYVYKISTQCNTHRDGLLLLHLLIRLKEQNLRCIILGMGKLGLITRIFGTLWGNEMIFAPNTKDESSAAGQITKKELELIFEILQQNIKYKK